MRTSKKHPPREVVNIIGPAEVQRMIGGYGGGHIEVRERQNGSWTVHYLEDGWIPCPPSCEFKHKHDVVRPMVEAPYKGMTLDQALVVADDYANGREVLIVEFMTPAERRAANRQAQTA